MKQSYNSSSDSSGMAVCTINAKLISEVTGVTSADFSRIQILDLHLKDTADDNVNNKRGKIRKIENIGFLTPNVSQLNLSYNIIVQMEGFGRLHHLVELNLAENAIRKIENIEALTALERLNLSGNQIQRIPETITTLQRLTNFRIARNELDVVKDLQYLSRLMNLTKLRIDENPFSKFEHTRHFAIHCVKSLVYLDGYAVTQEERVSARTLFASTDISELRGRLSEELHKLSLLKSDVGKSPERRLASRSMELSRYGGNQFKETQSEVNEAHMILGQKLQRIADVEANVDLLKRQLDILASTPLKPPAIDRSASPSVGATRNRRRFGSPIPFRDNAPATNTAYLGEAHSYNRYHDDGTPMTNRAYDPYDDERSPSMNTTTPNPHPLRDRSIELDRNNNNNNNNNSYNNNRVVRATSPSAEVATQQITQLNDRVEKLASKLVQSDREKSALQSQLAVERDRRQENTTNNSAAATAAAAADNHHVSILAEEVLQLRRQLQESDEALQRSKQEVSSVREELMTKSAELLSARAVVERNDAVKDSLKAELDTISAENAKIRNEMLDLRRTVVQSDEMMVPPEAQRLPSTIAGGTTSSFDQWKLHESRLDIAGKRVEIEELLRANEKLQKELEVLLFEVTAANEACLRATSEAEHYRSQAKAADDDHRKTMLRANELERDLLYKTKELTSMDQAREAIEQDRMHLQKAYTRLKEDMSSFMKARENTPMKRPVTPSGAVASRLSSMFRTNTFNDDPTGGADNYASSYLLELVSTDSDESTDARHNNKGKKSWSKSHSRSALKKTAVRSLSNQQQQQQQQQYQRMDFTQLELAASEVIAHVLLQEVRTMERDHANMNDSMKSLKEACIRAALRVIHSASMLQLDQVVSKSSADEDHLVSSSREGIAESKSHEATTTAATATATADGMRRRKGMTAQQQQQLAVDDVAPFAVLGSREYLSKIVADAYAGMVTIEDSDDIKLEIAQLEVGRYR